MGKASGFSCLSKFVDMSGPSSASRRSRVALLEALESVRRSGTTRGFNTSIELRLDSRARGTAPLSIDDEEDGGESESLVAVTVVGRRLSATLEGEILDGNDIQIKSAVCGCA